jgi:hypothetical protein
MTKRTTSLAILSLIITIQLISCKKDIVSDFGENRSHNNGQDCMSCHDKGGKGKGNFTVAGTVYDTLETSTFFLPTIILYKQPFSCGGSVLTIYGGGTGNFFTTKKVDLSAGVYPVVKGQHGHCRYMLIPTRNGACNSCHGVTTGKIIAK